MNDFASAAQKLIQGNFICEYSHPTDFSFLMKPGMSAEMDDYLRKMELSLSISNDGEGFYCSYLLPKQNITALKRQFTEIIESLSPLVSFLILVQQASGNDDVIRPGDVLRLAEIQGVVEDTPVLAVHLDKIVAHSLFKSTSPTIDGKLKQVFKRLVELDYLSLANPSHQIFMATSKWSLLMDQIGFINDSERLSLETLTDNAVKQNDLYE